MLKDIPREHDLVINTVKFHVLQAPSLVDPPGYMLFPQSGQVRGMIHPDFDTFRTKLGDQWRQQGCA